MELQTPYASLRVLETVVRHRNYSWAAEELDVTHSAISQSVKRLELQLGIKLFERRHGEMRPSQAALDLAAAYTRAERSLRRSLDEILADKIAIVGS